MQKSGEIDYEAYAKSMRAVLSGPEICLPDKSLNHEYFNAKKGYYWSQDSQSKLIDGIKAYGKDWKKICQEQFKGNKSEVEIQMRAYESEINEKQIQELQKKVKGAQENPQVINGHQTKNGNARHVKK